jgi:hypothetical protein
MNPLRPELQLLLSCSGVNNGIVYPQHLELIAEQVSDEKWLLERAKATALGPLLLKCLQEAGALTHFSKPFIDDLHKYSLRYTAHNIKLLAKLEQIVVALAKADVSYIPLKGVAMLEFVFKDIALRATGDIDLLIKEEEMSKAVEILRASGFNVQRLVSSDLDTEFVHHPYAIISDGISIELHRHIHHQLSRYQIDTHTFWNNAHADSALPGLGYRLHPSDQLLHLSTHLYRHMESNKVKFSWFVDILELIRQFGGNINPIQLRKDANSYGCVKEVDAILTTIKTFFKETLPESDLFFHALTVTRQYEFAHAVTYGYLSGDPVEVIAPQRTSSRAVIYASFIYFLRNGYFSKGVQLLSLTLFPLSSFMVNRYAIKHTWTLPFYYLYRVLGGLFGFIGNNFAKLVSKP